MTAAEQKCLVNNASLGFECSSVLYSYPFTATRMFIAQAAVDFEQCFQYSGCPSGRLYTDMAAAYVQYQHGIQATNLQVAKGERLLTASACLPRPCCRSWAGPCRACPKSIHATRREKSRTC